MKSNYILMLSVVFLSVIIVMCSCGGGIRVRENFLDEVVGFSGDDLQDTNILDNSVENVPELMNASETPPPSPTPTPPTVSEEITEEKEMPLAQNQVKPNKQTKAAAKPLMNVMGYSDCEYAKF
jgi:outer membrane biosynthesis protein TonB